MTSLFSTNFLHGSYFSRSGRTSLKSAKPRGIADISKYFRNSMNEPVYRFSPTDILQSSVHLKINTQDLHWGWLYIKFTLLKALGLFVIFKINCKEFNRPLAGLSYKKTSMSRVYFLVRVCARKCLNCISPVWIGSNEPNKLTQTIMR